MNSGGAIKWLLSCSCIRIWILHSLSHASHQLGRVRLVCSVTHVFHFYIFIFALRKSLRVGQDIESHFVLAYTEQLYRLFELARALEAAPKSLQQSVAFHARSGAAAYFLYSGLHTQHVAQLCGKRSKARLCINTYTVRS